MFYRLVANVGSARYPHNGFKRIKDPRYHNPRFVFYYTSSVLRDSDSNKPEYTVNWILKDGSTVAIKGKEGTHLLDMAHANDIDLEGACEASLACSTCHVIVENPEYYNKIPEASDEENDMLDLAFGLTDTSRLGCQVYLTKDLDGITVRLPRATRNMAVDGYVPKPH